MELKLKLIGNIDSLGKGLAVIAPRIGLLIDESGTPVELISGSDKLEIKKTSEGYTLAYGPKVEFFRGLALLCDAVKKGEDINLSEQRKFGTCGSMYDVSRGMVLKKETVFDLLETMALMGLDMFMLYTEDTYEMPKYPWFGYMRGRYSLDELKEIDDYGDMLGIEIIPCIQVLGHLATYLKWPATAGHRDTANCLLVGADDTYELIDEMFKTMRQAFRSNRIHIGLDEAMDLGTGKYLDLNGRKDIIEIMTEHLEKVVKMAEAYNYTPMIWSDMFFRMSGYMGEYDTRAEIPARLATDLPKNLEMVYWDYCMEDRKITDTIISKHEEMKRPVVFAGGIWTWNRICTCFKKSYDTAREQLIACADHGVDTVFATIWNNTHSDLIQYSVLPALQIWAELCYDPEATVEKIGQRFEACTGYDFESWQTLFAEDYTDEEIAEYKASNAFCINTAFVHFYKDIRIPIMDKSLEGYDFKAKYDSMRKAIAKSDCGDKRELFERHKVLYEILYLKSYLGYDIKAAYKAGDKSKLTELTADLEKLIVYYKEYHKLTKKMWFDLCKPYGYDRLDEAIAGVTARTVTTLDRVNAYIAGDIDVIEELDQEVLPYRGIEKPLLEVNRPEDFARVF